MTPNNVRDRTATRPPGASAAAAAACTRHQQRRVRAAGQQPGPHVRARERVFSVHGCRPLTRRRHRACGACARAPRAAMATLLEQTRAAHEEMERLERLIVSELSRDARSHRERLAQGHRVRAMVDRICDRAAKLVRLVLSALRLTAHNSAWLGAVRALQCKLGFVPVPDAQPPGGSSGRHVRGQGWRTQGRNRGAGRRRERLQARPAGGPPSILLVAHCAAY